MIEEHHRFSLFNIIRPTLVDRSLERYISELPILEQISTSEELVNYAADIIDTICLEHPEEIEDLQRIHSQDLGALRVFLASAFFYGMISMFITLSGVPSGGTED